MDFNVSSPSSSVSSLLLESSAKMVWKSTPFETNNDGISDDAHKFTQEVKRVIFSIPYSISSSKKQSRSSSNIIIQDPAIYIKDCDALYCDYLHLSLGQVQNHITIPDAKRKGPRGGVIVPFPEKLYHMLETVEEEGLSNIVSWQPHGRCFIIRNRQVFTEKIIQRFFNHSKFSSFQRQLNLYNFHKVISGIDRGGIYHPLFLRNRPELITAIYRINAPKHKDDNNESIESDYYEQQQKIIHNTKPIIDSTEYQLYKSFYELPSCPTLQDNMNDQACNIGCEVDDTHRDIITTTTTTRTIIPSEEEEEYDDNAEIIPHNLLMQALSGPYNDTSSNSVVHGATIPPEKIDYDDLNVSNWIRLSKIDNEESINVSPWGESNTEKHQPAVLEEAQMFLEQQRQQSDSLYVKNSNLPSHCMEPKSLIQAADNNWLDDDKTTNNIIQQLLNDDDLNLFTQFCPATKK